MNEYGIYIYNSQQFREKITLNRPSHPTYSSFFILKKGTLIYEKHLQTVEINQPILTFIDSTSVYEFSYLSDDLDAMVISFTSEFTESLSLKTNSLSSYKYFKENVGRYLTLNKKQLNELIAFATLFESILANSEAHSDTRSILSSVFSGLIQLISEYTDLTIDINKKISRSELITLEFLKNLELFLKTEQEVNFYAEKQFITSRHLSSTLKSVTGKTAGQIIADFLLKEAKAILVDSDKHIYEIANELGFSDGYTFSHFFKKQASVSPSEYRNTYAALI